MNALKAFEAVSRPGSVSKAAEELCVSQGAVSQQLRNLEDHLDRELFIRTPNSFTLSEVPGLVTNDLIRAGLNLRAWFETIPLPH